MTLKEYLEERPAEGDYTYGVQSSQDDLENASSAPVRLPRGSKNWERADRYRGVLFQVSDSWRVVVCRDGLQWILQQREGRDHWEGKHFFSRKSHLGEAIKEKFGEKVFSRVKARIDLLPI